MTYPEPKEVAVIEATDTIVTALTRERCAYRNGQDLIDAIDSVVGDTPDDAPARIRVEVLCEALRHAGWGQGRSIVIRWVDSEALTPENYVEHLAGAAGVVVPGGFGHRATTCDGRPLA